MNPPRTPPDEWQSLAEETGSEAGTHPRSRGRRPALRRGLRPSPRRLWLGGLLGMAWAAAAWGWHGPFNPWPPGPSQQELLDGQEAAMALAAQAIRDYARGHNGAYPSELGDVLPLQLVIEYRPTGQGFELQARGVGGAPLLLRSR